MRAIMIFMMVLGPALLAGGMWLIIRNVTVVLREPVANGVITNITSFEDTTANDNGSGSRTRFAPIIEYQVAGTAYHIQGASASTYTSITVGQAVPVRYDPAHPERGQVDSFQSIWLGPLGLTILGLPFSFVSLAIARPGRPQKPAPA